MDRQILWRVNFGAGGALQLFVGLSGLLDYVVVLGVPTNQCFSTMVNGLSSIVNYHHTVKCNAFPPSYGVWLMRELMKHSAISDTAAT